MIVDTSHTRVHAPDIKPPRRRQRRRNPVKPLPGSWKEVCRDEDKLLRVPRKLPKKTLIEMYAGAQAIRRHTWRDTYNMRKRVYKKLLKWDELVLKLLTGEA